jgi:hypothetical protein
MVKALKELGLLAISVTIGMVLLLVSSYHVTSPAFGVTVWGYPLWWRSFVDDYVGEIGREMNWNALILDFGFWVALSIAVVETLFRAAVPYVRRQLVNHTVRPNMEEAPQNAFSGSRRKRGKHLWWITR